MVDCVGPGPQSNEQVDQKVTVCPIDDLHTIAAAILTEHVKQPEHKVMVFLPTAREAGFCAALFRQMASVHTPIFEIHSKKSQPQRTATSEQFRTCQSGILFSSDVSARGMDYPDVTFVLQVGAPHAISRRTSHDLPPSPTFHGLLSLGRAYLEISHTCCAGW